jgi:hypothetical protein
MQVYIVGAGTDAPTVDTQIDKIVIIMANDVSKMSRIAFFNFVILLRGSAILYSVPSSMN